MIANAYSSPWHALSFLWPTSDSLYKFPPSLAWLLVFVFYLIVCAFVNICFKRVGKTSKSDICCCNESVLWKSMEVCFSSKEWPKERRLSVPLNELAGWGYFSINETWNWFDSLIFWYRKQWGLRNHCHISYCPFSMIESSNNHPVDYIPHANGAVLRCRYQTRFTEGQRSYGSNYTCVHLAQLVGLLQQRIVPPTVQHQACWQKFFNLHFHRTRIALLGEEQLQLLLVDTLEFV